MVWTREAVPGPSIRPASTALQMLWREADGVGWRGTQQLQCLKPSLASGWEVLEERVDSGPAGPSAGPRKASRGVHHLCCLLFSKRVGLSGDYNEETEAGAAENQQGNRAGM